MIAPTTLAVAEIFSAENTNGSEEGRRRSQSTERRWAAYDRISSSERGSGESSPRSVFIATGKKVRNAAITETATHGWTPFVPRPTTTIGATARMGTVCATTTEGGRPRLRH